MPLRPVIEFKIFDLWGIDFMGPFPNSNGFELQLITCHYGHKQFQQELMTIKW